MKNSIASFKAVVLLLSVMFLVSCDDYDKAPEPSENPFLVTSEAQTKKLYIKYFLGIAPLNETDEVIYEDDDQYKIIKADWISYKIYASYSDGIVNLNIQENTSAEPRSHQIELTYKIKSTILTVTQAGKP